MNCGAVVLETNTYEELCSVHGLGAFHREGEI